MENKKKQIGFRPLPGIMVLINGDGYYLALIVNEVFPSPYGDYGSYLVSKAHIR